MLPAPAQETAPQSPIERHTAVTSVAPAGTLRASRWQILILLPRAIAWLGIAQLGLSRVGYAHTARLLSPPAGHDRGRSRTGSDWRAEQAVRALALATRLLPGSVTCLPRALALRRLLGDLGVAGELRLGVKTTGAGPEAHAWVEVDGVPVGETAAPSHHYAVLDSAAAFQTRAQAGGSDPGTPTSEAK